MGGSLEFERPQAGGSRFCLSFSPQQASRPDQLTDGAQSENNKQGEIQGLKGRVLLVEDNKVNQRVAQRMLERLGLQVEIAANGRAAVERSSNEHFDLIMMDCQMPVMDGYEAARLIRASGNRAPIVALTAHALATERDRCWNVGMNDCLIKPFHFDDLREIVRKWLASSL